MMSELSPVCFSCSTNFNLSQSSSALEDKNIVFDSFRFWIFGFEEYLTIAGDLSNLNTGSSVGLLRISA